MVSQDSTRDRWNPDPFENNQQIQEQLNLCCIARVNTGGAQESGQEQESSQDAENTPPLLSSGKNIYPSMSRYGSVERGAMCPILPYRLIALSQSEPSSFGSWVSAAERLPPNYRHELGSNSRGSWRATNGPHRRFFHDEASLELCP